MNPSPFVRPTRLPRAWLLVAAFALPAAAASAATITVTSTQDGSIADACTLRDAVRAANLDQSTQACAAGSGTDVIRFEAGVDAIDLLDAGGGTLLLRDSTILDGEGRQVTIRRPATQSPFRVIEVSSPDLNARSLELRWITVTGGSADDGGGLSSRGPVTLRDSRILANSATDGNGGGVYVYADTTVIRSTIADNSVTDGFGGGLFIYANLSLIDSTVSGNSTHGFYGDGGGIWAANRIALTNSTVSGNSVGDARGAGLFTEAFDVAPEEFCVVLTNSTVAGNRAGAQARWPSGVRVGYTDCAQIALRSSLVWGNSGLDLDSNVDVIAGGSNSLVGTFDNVALPADTLRCDPQLLPLGRYGGPTATHALPGGSCAVDKGGNPAELAYDQRGSGYPRVFGAAADIGAYERGDLIFADGFEGG
jgi:hypothetical protein